MGFKRWAISLVVLCCSVVLPAALCLGVALAPARSIADAALMIFGAAVWMALLALVNWWEFTSLWLRWGWAAALAAAAAQRLRGLSGLGTAPGVVGSGGAVLVAVGMWPLVRALAARGPGGDVVHLSWPFSLGRFLVTDGGDGARSFLVNYHYGFGRHRSSGVNRSMRYAMDIVEIDRAGTEARGFLPLDNEAYRIWEKPLYAPCDGRVVHAVNDVVDNTAFGRQRPYGVGNHVVIRKGDDIYVVLGHMRSGSVAVSEGDVVRAGDAIGRVGNSGWTERPHLHMQATRSANADWWHGEGLAIRFAGRFLVKNQVMRAPGDREAASGIHSV